MVLFARVKDRKALKKLNRHFRNCLKEFFIQLAFDVI